MALTPEQEKQVDGFLLKAGASLRSYLEAWQQSWPEFNVPSGTFYIETDTSHIAGSTVRTDASVYIVRGRHYSIADNQALVDRIREDLYAKMGERIP